jgi:hypothetical protein
MRLRPVSVILLAVVLAGCAGGGRTVSGYLDEYGGSRAVYERIADMSDCASVQAEYDAAAANNEVLDGSTDEYRWTSGYMAAAEDRLEELDCETTE